MQVITEKDRTSKAYLTVVITSSNLVDLRDKAIGFMETRIVVMREVCLQKIRRRSRMTWSLVIPDQKERTHKYLKSSPTKPRNAPTCSSLQLPRILV